MTAHVNVKPLERTRVYETGEQAMRAVVHTCPDFETFLSEPDAGLLRGAFRLVEREGVGTAR